jgi:hypothetical protein
VDPSDFGVTSDRDVLSAPESELRPESDAELAPESTPGSGLEPPSDDAAGEGVRRFALRSFLAQPDPL